jgi:Uma2 family endonuclease
MYDLPSEDPEEPGLPDMFHLFQPSLLRNTFRPPNHPEDRVFVASDVNLYYDVNHKLWHKRPDWFAVLGVPRNYGEKGLRLSYVVWDEKVSPFIVVELLSPGTEDEDLGIKLRDAEQPPGKWEVYERILKVPYYAIFNRYNCQFQMFELKNGRYVAARFADNRFWIEELGLGLGVWEGSYDKTEEQPWLRWYDATGNWVLISDEVADAEKQRADAEKQRADAEKQRADAEKQRADAEKQRADSERQEKERERQRADSERQEKEMLIARLRSLGVDC